MKGTSFSCTNGDNFNFDVEACGESISSTEDGDNFKFCMTFDESINY